MDMYEKNAVGSGMDNRYVKIGNIYDVPVSTKCTKPYVVRAVFGQTLSLSLSFVEHYLNTTLKLRLDISNLSHKNKTKLMSTFVR